MAKAKKQVVQEEMMESVEMAGMPEEITEVEALEVSEETAADETSVYQARGVLVL